MKRKRRSVAASRAASLKAWRTRKEMAEMRAVEEKYNYPLAKFLGHFVDEISSPTIDRIPKVEWK